MKTTIIIPARYGSTRLAGKMLLAATGKPLIHHVYEQCKKSSRAQRVIIATDDDRIASAVQNFDGEYIMTSANHPTGTDRLAEVARTIASETDLIINVQGDEPEVNPAKIDLLITMHQAHQPFMGTLVIPFNSSMNPADPNRVKAIVGNSITKNNVTAVDVLYFTRALAPYDRDNEGAAANLANYMFHPGMYSYTPAALQQFVSWPPAALEQLEKLEQLRALANGQRIMAAVTTDPHAGIDVQADYDAFVARYLNKGN